MGNIGGGEVLVILLAALIILGPTKLPEVARQMGKALGEFRKVTTGFQRELHDAMSASDEAEARRRGEAVAATRPVASEPPHGTEAAAMRTDDARVDDAADAAGTPEGAHDTTTRAGSGRAANGGAPAVGPEIDDHH